MSPPPDPSSPTAAAPDGARTVKRTIDPQGRHALFSAPPKAAPDQLGTGDAKEGRHAFYSTGPRRPGTVVIRCSTCKTRSRVGLVDLGVRFVSISAWLPGRKHSHWMRCPSCNEHTWCAIGWTD